MDTKQSKADLSQEPGSTLAGAPSNRQLGIQFSPAVAFAVSCNPAETKPAAKQREGRRSSVKGTRYLAAKIGHSTSAVAGNAGAPSQA